MSAGKGSELFIRRQKTVLIDVYFTRYRGSSRAVPPEELQRLAEELTGKRWPVFDDSAAAWDAAATNAERGRFDLHYRIVFFGGGDARAGVRHLLPRGTNAVGRGMNASCLATERGTQSSLPAEGTYNFAPPFFPSYPDANSDDFSSSGREPLSTAFVCARK